MEDSIIGNLNRRSFLRSLSVFAVALPVFELGALGLTGCDQARSLSRSGDAGSAAKGCDSRSSAAA